MADDPTTKLTPWTNFYREHFQRFFFTPLIMNTQVPLFQSALVNTDELGLRKTLNASKKSISLTDIANDQPINILVGGSVVFGWGCKGGDAKTIASQLCQITGKDWLNFGVCAQTLQQGMILTLFAAGRLKNVQNLIFIGGYNEIASFLAASSSSEFFGTIFNQKVFHEAMNESTHQVYSNADLFKGSFHQLPERSIKKIEVFEKSIQTAICTLKNMGSCLKANILFVLQPYPDWMERTLTANEKLLWDFCIAAHKRAVDEGLNKWFYSDLAEAKSYYSSMISEICEQHKVNIINLNDELSNESFKDEWLFIDPAHMTDAANEIISDILAEKCVF